MISGRVIYTRKPLVPVIVLDSQRNPHTIQFVLDTGFTGQLLLPDRYMDRLGLSISEWIDARSATGGSSGCLSLKPRLSGREPNDEQKSFNSTPSPSSAWNFSGTTASPSTPFPTAP